MLFRDTTVDDRFSTLYLNEMNNVEGRFKTLQNVNVDDNSMIDEKQAELRNHLLSVKVNNTPLFIGIE